ncbi:peptidase, M50 family protein [Synechococcus sp. PCC 7335]|uniref:site-2 protease family protein n=1 Tax=Synechococcus sp. (strain ATCC 29403 / PCC 7335) TaxID=91464 RepID=UPI00017EB10E|nr:site-2 protease family protein [Synechococcus sp. PCC 7335]EDX87461.1 peptidase, M50 family protein [Synechococcus sp. PCC 7335]
MITVLLLAAAIGILAWGFSKAQPLGRPGILAWLQTVVLMVPWLLFFGFSAVGIYLNLAGILLLVVSSTGLYIYFGRQLRAASQEELAAQSVEKASKLAEKAAEQKAGKEEDAALADNIAVERANEATEQLPLAGDSLAKGAEDKGAEGDSVDGNGVKESDEVDIEDQPSPPIPPEDLAIMEGFFGINTFFRTKTVPFQEGAVFKGNLRGEAEKTSQELSQKLVDKFGDRYQSFLLLDPEDKPVVVIFPSKNGPKSTTLPQRILAVALAIATIATCMETAAVLQSFDIFQSPERWREALPIGLGILSILGIHEIGHLIYARKHSIRLSPPFLLPAWQLGAFGAITRFESVIPNRTVLFNIAFAGPAAGGIFSFICLFWGLVLSQSGSPFQLPAEFFRGSILVGGLARLILGDALQADLVDVQPLFIVGWIGLIITAINLLPAGQLDGGRVVQSIYGRKTLVRSTAVTLVLLAIVGLFNPLALYWAVLIVFLQRQPERPCTDDLSEPNDTRAALALASLLLVLLVLLPLTPTLARRLGIG